MSRELVRTFDGYDQLTVRQKKSWTEILLSFEMRNRYEVFDQMGQAVLVAQEVDSGFSGFLARIFLGPLRPFEVSITDQGTGMEALRLRRPFRFIFHELEVTDGDGRPLGTIRRKWSWLRRIYEVTDATSGQRMDIFGPFFRPWTFELRVDGQPLGAIRKRWSGLGKEMFTDADNFGVELGMLPSTSLRALAFAATVLVDVVHFENSKG